MSNGGFFDFEELPGDDYESDVGGGTAPQKTLGYVTVQQEQTNWCWAAVSLAMADFYGAGHGWTQCKIVNTDLGRTDCCEAGGSAPCNVENVIYGALGHVGHYAGKKEKGKQAFDAVRDTVDADRPLAVLIKWFRGGGHFVSIYGYDAAGSMMHVGDPWSGEAYVAHDEFPGSYEIGGKWHYSYWTQP